MKTPAAPSMLAPLMVLTLAALSCFSTVACAPSNPQRMAPPEVYAESGQAAPVQATTVVKPKVDVLFVVDNSESMSRHQENLRRNIDRFVEAFQRNTRIDFHIGVTSVHDGVRYGSVVQNFHPLGLLYPPRSNPAELITALGGTSFVTRVPQFNEILGETLKIGVIPRYTGTGAQRVDGGGPEFEELFSPVVAALDGRNGDFLRADAHLAVIMITDADDASSIAPSALDQALFDIKGRQRSAYSTFAVLALDGCRQDPGGAPTRIREFLRISRGRAYNLCDARYGDRLAEVGRIIETRAARQTRILLEAIPEANTLRVTFAGTEDSVPGWQYDSENAAVVIPSNAMDGRPADAQVSITYTPVDGRRIGTARTRPVTQ